MKGTSVLREQNEKRIISFIRKQIKTSRHDIATQLNISKNTVSLIIENLINQSVVIEKGSQNLSKKGRPKRILELSSEGYKCIGFSIDINQIEMTIIDYYGNIIESSIIKVNTVDVNSLISLISSAIKELSFRHQIIGIGIAIPGAIDSKNFIVKHSLRLGWKNVSFQELMNLNFPIFIQNNVNMIALTEVISRQYEKFESIFYIRISKGIGGAYYSTSNIITGVSGTAGEIGHISVDPQGVKCYCGQNGCLEKLISLNSFYSQVESISHTPINLRQLLFSKNDLYNSEIDELMFSFGHYLSRSIVTLIHLINPHAIIIDSVYSHNNTFKLSVLNNVNQDTLEYPLQDTHISFLENNKKVSHGAAIHSIFEFERIENL